MNVIWIALRSARLWACLALLVTLLSVLPGPARAAEPEEQLSIWVLTFGPGDHPFFKFGHNAIWVHDGEHGRDYVYNFGTFEFDSPWLILDFLKSKLHYWLSVQSLPGTLYGYKMENRSVLGQELNLTPAQREQLMQALEWNAREDNKYYRYDYYLDNCSTRVRDAIDQVLGGAIRAQTQGPAEMTWRDHTRRLTADDLPVYLGLHVAMGDFIDRKITVWEEMFLPEKVEQALRTVRVETPSGPQPLVLREKLFVRADRPPERTAPPHWEIPMALVGVAIGGLFALLGWLSTSRRAARALLGSLLAIVAGAAGFLGCVFVFLWTATDHAVAYHNENILQLGPWLLPLAVLGWGVARGRLRHLRWARLLVNAAAAASLLGLVAKLLPSFDQNNGEIIALCLPLWSGGTIGLFFAARLPAVAANSTAQTESGKARQQKAL